MVDEVEAGKRAKSSVDYSEGGDVCGACKHWIEAAENESDETGKCELVAGSINEFYWCRLFARKKR